MPRWQGGRGCRHSKEVAGWAGGHRLGGGIVSPLVAPHASSGSGGTWALDDVVGGVDDDVVGSWDLFDAGVVSGWEPRWGTYQMAPPKVREVVPAETLDWRTRARGYDKV